MTLWLLYHLSQWLVDMFCGYFTNMSLPIQMVSKLRAEMVTIFVYYRQPQHVGGSQ